jgi:hypothetical protein
VSAAYGTLFVVLGALAALVAVLAGAAVWPVAVASAWAALALAVVAVAYFGAGPRVLLKRATGTWHPVASVALAPYFALVWFSYHVSRAFLREAAFVGVASNVILGRRLTAREARAACDGWVAVLDLAAELTEAPALRAVAHYRSLPVLDGTAMPLAQLADAAEWVKRHAADGPVYVHCAFGHSRSALVVAAVLLATGAAPDARAAVAHLRELRPGVRLNRSQRARLKEFAERDTTSAPCR